MPSTYTVNLGIEKPATGEQSGTWGDTTNTNFDILDQGINGAVRVTLSSAGSSGSPNALVITNGAASDGRNKWIEFYSSGDLGGNVFVQLQPNDAEKIVFIRNSLASSRSVLLFQGTYNSGRDLEIPAGVDMVVKFDGGGASAANVTDVYNNLKVTGLVAGTADINGGTVDGTVIGGASAAALTATTVVANTSVNIAGDGATVTGIKDEDNMASNSATKLATQQSIKAYVDSQVGTVDTLAEILANGNETGSNDIDVDGAQKVAFRDSAIYIHSSTDGQLDIVADTEIQIAATTIDINGAIVASGDIAAASLDISGNVDIDGVLNVDAIDIDGAVQLDNTLTVGVDDTGYDVKFYGATGGAYMLWDQSADDLILAGAGGLVVAGNVDFNGDLDVDGTTNLDVVDIDGAVDMASTLAVDTRVGIGVAAHASAALNITTTDQHIRFNNGSELGIIDLDSDGELNIWAHGDGEVINLKTGSGTGNNILSIAGSASTFSGTVTANAGVVVDNITIDGNEIDVGSGVLTLDVASDIRLDAGGGNIQLLKGGTEFGRFFEAGTNDFYVYNPNSDKDIIIYGNDAGTSFEAARFDMSASGRATFNNNVVVTDNNSLIAGSGDDLQIFYNGTNGEIDVSSGNLTLDVAGRIILDADTDGDVRFLDGGTQYGQIFNASSDMYIRSNVQDKDIIFNGNDGGNFINALTLDMSNAGQAIFNKGASFADHVYLADNAKLTLGGGDDGTLYSDGTNIIQTSTGNLTLDVAGTITLDADNTGTIYLSDGGTNYGLFFQDSNRFFIQSQVSDADMLFRGSDAGTVFTALTLDMSAAGAATFNSSVTTGGLIKLGGTGTDNDSHAINFVNGACAIARDNNDLELHGYNAISFGVSNTSYPTTTERFRIASDGAATFSSTIAATGQITSARGSDTGTYGFRHEGAGKYMRMGVANASFAYFETDANGGFSFEGDVSVANKIIHAGDTNTYIDFTSDVLDLYSGGSLGVRIQPTAVTINEAGADYDFRVESDANTHAIYVDGGNNSVTLGSSSSASNTIRTQSTAGFQASTDGSFGTTKSYTFRDGVGIDNPNSSSYSTATAAVLCVGAMSTGRSINATGTVNASGADYAEYEANNGLVISKGSIVGFKTDGTLTLTFSEAVRFAVKSTDPAYVGGDTWSDVEPPEKNTAAWDTWFAETEAKRAKVDRVAYSGKVPVNVQGATAGQYIIAVANSSGEITGQAVTDPDFSQYKLSVGRVNRILEDGRAELAVIIH